MSGASCKLVGSYKPQRAARAKARIEPVLAARGASAGDSLPAKGVAMGSAVLWYDELRKLVLRGLDRRMPSPTPAAP